MNIQKLGLLLLSGAVVGVAVGPAAHAGFAVGNSVTLGGNSIFQMANCDGVTGEHRAWQTQDALDNALVLAQNRSPDAVTVSRENGAITVLVDGRRVATADSNTANDENITASDLADKWAQSIKTFLSDKDRTDTYVATLVNEHTVHATALLSERTMYAPAGFTFPITLNTQLTGSTVQVGDKVEATINRDAPLGTYVIASGSVLIGEVVQDAGDNFGIHFTSLRTPNGTQVTIDAIVMDDSMVGNVGPHLVSTQVIPAGSAIGVPYVECRIPSSVGAGAVGEMGSHLFAFRRDSGLIAVGRPLNVVFETITPVAVIMRMASL